MSHSYQGLTRRVLHWGGNDALTFLLDVVFADYADDAAPITSPIVGRVGELAITDTGNLLSITSGVLVASSNPGFNEGFGKFTSSHVPTAGDAIYAARSGSLAAVFAAAYYDASGGNNVRDNLAVLFDGTGWRAYFGLSSDLVSAGLNQTPVEVVLVARNPGYYAFFRDSGGDWYLVWVNDHQDSDTADPLVAVFHPSTTGITKARVADLPANGYTIFGSSYGYAKVNASPGVSGTEYSALADAHIRQTITAPSSLAGEAGIKFRKQDANNYWYAYFDSAGAFKLDKYVSGSPDGSSPYINVAGVIAAGETGTIYPIFNGTNIDIYTIISGAAPNKQGGTITDSSYTAQSVCEPYATAAWVSGGGSLGRLEAYAYTVSDEATGEALAALNALST